MVKIKKERKIKGLYSVIPKFFTSQGQERFKGDHLGFYILTTIWNFERLT